MTDLRKRLSVTTLAFLALAFCGLLIGQAVANNDRVREVNADNSIETGVPLPTFRGPTESALTDGDSQIEPGSEREILGDGSIMLKVKRGPQVVDGIPKGLGDEFSTPFVMGAVPYSHTGDNTSGMDLYSSNACGYDPCIDYGACVADQWFAYTPAANVRVVITTGNAYPGGDQMLVVFQDDLLTPIACSDDISGSDFRSRLTDVHFDLGHTYYIFLDGWAGGPYQLDVTVFVPPPAFNETKCPLATVTEVETCGQRINGGTYGNPTGPAPWPTTPALVSDYNSGQLLPGNIPAPNMICGVLDASPLLQTPNGLSNGLGRDADAYRWRQTVWQKMLLSFQNETQCAIFINGLGNGAAPGGITSQVYISPLPALQVWTTQVTLIPGYWYTINIRANTVAFPCGTNPIPASGGNPRYYIETIDIPLTPIDDCPLGLEYSGDTPVGTPIVVDMTGMTGDGSYTYPGYGTQSYIANAWIHWTAAQTGEYTISACTTPNVGGETFDLYMGVHRAPCPSTPSNQKGFSDDGAACPGYEPELMFVAVEDFDYNISIGNWMAPTAGPAWIEISHTPIPLLGDNCAVARIPATEDKMGEFFNNLNATLDAPDTTDCNAHQFGGDIWFEMTAWATGYAYARFCDVEYDANLEVYPGDVCPTRENRGTVDPIRCNDDGCPQLLTSWPQLHGSATSWPVVTGEKYLIRVGGWYNPPDNPLETGGMGIGWYDMFITTQPDTLVPVNDDCVDMTPILLADGVANARTGDLFYVTRNDCNNLDIMNALYPPQAWEAFTVPAGACMTVMVDFFGSVDVYNNGSRYAATSGSGLAWTGCPCEGDFFPITADLSCLNPNTCGASANPPGSDFNNVHFFTTMPPGDYWFELRDAAIGLLEHEFAYNMHITGTITPCVYCPASSLPAQCTNLGSWINRVILKLALPTNQPGDTVINNTVAGTGCHNYENFTGLLPMPKVYKGFAYALQVRYAKVNESNYHFDTVGYWADWNQNSVFFDPGERFMTARHGVPIEGRVFDTFTVPMTALGPGQGPGGETRLRFRLTSTTGNVSAYCGTAQFGEVEDYALAVKDLECGDFNIDGNLNSDDIAFLRAWYFGTGPAARIWQRGDIDGVGGITIADIIALADAAYRGGALNCM